MARYDLIVTIDAPYDEVKERLAQALKTQGFGILTEIDVEKTLREKLGAEYERYEILGACNPKLAHRALSADRSVGLLLPCNVVMRDTDAGVEVSALDPEAMFTLADPTLRRELADLATEAREGLRRALDELEALN